MKLLELVACTVSLAGLALISSMEAKDKTIFHIAVQGSTQLSCKVTHKATKAEPYLLLTCEYRCDQPKAVTYDVKKDQENIYCSGTRPDSPAAQGQPLDSEDTSKGDDSQ